MTRAPENLRGLFDDDSSSQDQFYTAFRGGSDASGERKLMLAVLGDAIVSYRKYATSQDGQGRQMFQEAEAWIQSRDREWFFSYENICDTLKLSPSYIREGLVNWKRDQVERRKEHDDVVVSLKRPRVRDNVKSAGSYPSRIQSSS